MRGADTYVDGQDMAQAAPESGEDGAVFDLLGAEIRRRRKAAGLSQERLAARLVASSSATVDQGFLSKVETGAKPPPAALVEALDRALNAGGDLVRLYRQAALQMKPDKGGVTRSPRELVGMTARRAREFALSHTAALSAETLDQVYDEIRTLADAYPRTPLPELLGPLTEAQDAVFTLLEQRQRPMQARQLYLLAGVAGGLLAKASHDLAEPLAAMTHARAAFVCADNAEHDGLRAWVRGLQSLIAYWSGRHSEAVHYAQAGAEFADRTGGSARVWLGVSEARGWAALGNAVEARTALDRADHAWDGHTPDDLDDIGGICTFSRARQLYYAADAMTWLPVEGDAAAMAAESAVEAYSDPQAVEWAFGDQAGSHASLAIARLSQGELDGAVEAVDPILDLLPTQRINGVLASVRRVHAAVASSPHADERVAGHLREEIEAFTRTPAAALPR